MSSVPVVRNITYKQFSKEQKAIFTTKYPFLTSSQIENKVRGLWKKNFQSTTISPKSVNEPRKCNGKVSFEGASSDSCPGRRTKTDSYFSVCGSKCKVDKLRPTSGKSGEDVYKLPDSDDENENLRTTLHEDSMHPVKQHENRIDNRDRKLSLFDWCPRRDQNLKTYSRFVKAPRPPPFDENRLSDSDEERDRQLLRLEGNVLLPAGTRLDHLKEKRTSTKKTPRQKLKACSKAEMKPQKQRTITSMLKSLRKSSDYNPTDEGYNRNITAMHVKSTGQQRNILGKEQVLTSDDKVFQDQVFDIEQYLARQPVVVDQNDVFEHSVKMEVNRESVSSVHSAGAIIKAEKSKETSQNTPCETQQVLYPRSSNCSAKHTTPAMSEPFKSETFEKASKAPRKKRSDSAVSKLGSSSKKATRECCMKQKVRRSLNNHGTKEVQRREEHTSRRITRSHVLSLYNQSFPESINTASVELKMSTSVNRKESGNPKSRSKTKPKGDIKLSALKEMKSTQARNTRGSMANTAMSKQQEQIKPQSTAYIDRGKKEQNLKKQSSKHTACMLPSVTAVVQNHSNKNGQKKNGKNLGSQNCLLMAGRCSDDLSVAPIKHNVLGKDSFLTKGIPSTPKSNIRRAPPTPLQRQGDRFSRKDIAAPTNVFKMPLNPIRSTPKTDPEILKKAIEMTEVNCVSETNTGSFKPDNQTITEVIPEPPTDEDIILKATPKPVESISKQSGLCTTMFYGKKSESSKLLTLATTVKKHSQVDKLKPVEAQEPERFFEREEKAVYAIRENTDTGRCDVEEAEIQMREDSTKEGHCPSRIQPEEPRLLTEEATFRMEEHGTFQTPAPLIPGLIRLRLTPLVTIDASSSDEETPLPSLAANSNQAVEDALLSLRRVASPDILACANLQDYDTDEISSTLTSMVEWSQNSKSSTEAKDIDCFGLGDGTHFKTGEKQGLSLRPTRDELGQGDIASINQKAGQDDGPTKTTDQQVQKIRLAENQEMSLCDLFEEPRKASSERYSRGQEKKTTDFLDFFSTESDVF